MNAALDQVKTNVAEPRDTLVMRDIPAKVIAVAEPNGANGGRNLTVMLGTGREAKVRVSAEAFSAEAHAVGEQLKLAAFKDPAGYISLRIANPMTLAELLECGGELV